MAGSQTKQRRFPRLLQVCHQKLETVAHVCARRALRSLRVGFYDICSSHKKRRHFRDGKHQFYDYLLACPHVAGYFFSGSSPVSLSSSTRSSSGFRLVAAILRWRLTVSMASSTPTALATATFRSQHHETKESRKYETSPGLFEAEGRWSETLC